MRLKFFFSLFFLLSLFLSLLLLIFCFSFSQASQITKPFDVIINEIAWMGTTNSTSDEWVELYNNTDGNINLDGWFLESDDGKPKVKLSGTIPANGFYLLERTDNNTVPNIVANKIYTGALNNGGEFLKLYDNNGDMVDEVNCDTKWFSGNNTTKQTMERKNSKSLGSDSLNWQSSQSPGGTPKTKNSQGKEITVKNTEKVQDKGSDSLKNISASEHGKEKELAAIGKQFTNSSNFLFVLLTAFGIAVFSGVVILIIKTKFLANR